MASINKKNKRYKIGVLINRFRDKYPHIIWKCLKKIAKKNKIDLVIFVGDSINSPYENYKEHNIIYEFVDKNYLDGIIFVASIGTFISHSEYENFINKFSSLPRVSLSIKINNVTSILVDNANGINEAVKHCVEQHGYKRIAFIRGPEGHKEADERFFAYKESLEKFKIMFDPEIVMQGNYVIDSGKREVEKLLKSGKKVDVIISSNDDMVLGAIEAINNYGLNVPDDIAVIGFDDWEETRFHIPSICSVKQPIEEQIDCAFKSLIMQINGEEKINDITLPTTFLPRHSCGCFSQEIAVYENIIAKEKSELDYDLIKLLDSLIKHILKIKNQDYLKLKVDRLIDNLKKTIKNKDGMKSFLNSLFYVLVNTGINDENIQLWLMILNVLKQKSLENANDIEKIKLINDIFNQSNQLIAKIQESKQANERFNLKNSLLGLHAVSQNLITQFDFNGLLDMITEELPHLNINNFYVLLYKSAVEKNDEIWILPKYLEVILSIENKKPVKYESSIMDIKEIFTFIFGRVGMNKNWIIMPLFFQSEHFGILIMEAGHDEGMVYETLRMQISSAIKGAMILEKEKKIGEALEMANNELKSLSFHDELTGVYNRRGFFTLSEELFKLANRSKYSFLLMFLDLDNLKIINDTYGHKDGDYIIKAFSDLLKSLFRESDLICRMGGDEFIVLVYNCGIGSVEIIMNKLTNAIEKFNNETDKPYKMSTSIGISCYDPDNPKTIDELMSISDKELYKNKSIKKALQINF